MTLAAQGAFIRLLCHQWKNGDLPDDEVRLAKLLIVDPIEFKTVWLELVVVFPVCEEGRRQNRRLEVERAKRQGRSSAAKESASRRWDKPAEETVGDKPPKQQRTPRAPKEPEQPKAADPNSPYAKIERILEKVKIATEGSAVQRADVVRQLRTESPINLLLQIFDEDAIVDMYVFAAKNWSGSVSWSAVHSQRDSIKASMKRPAGGGNRRGKESTEEKYQRLQQGGSEAA